MAKGPLGRARNAHSENMARMESSAELDKTQGFTDCHLYLLETMERQKPHNGAKTTAEARVGSGDNSEALQEVADLSMAL